MSTKVLYQYINNIGRLQLQLLRLGLMCISAGMGTLRALAVVQKCIKRSKNLGLHSPTTDRGHSLPDLLIVRDFLRELIPTLFDPIKICQVREDVGHSLCHDFEIGLMKPERHLADIQRRERAL